MSSNLLLASYLRYYEVLIAAWLHTFVCGTSQMLHEIVISIAALPLSSSKGVQHSSEQHVSTGECSYHPYTTLQQTLSTQRRRCTARTGTGVGWVSGWVPQMFVAAAC